MEMDYRVLRDMRKKVIAAGEEIYLDWRCGSPDQDTYGMVTDFITAAVLGYVQSGCVLGDYCISRAGILPLPSTMAEGKQWVPPSNTNVLLFAEGCYWLQWAADAGSLRASAMLRELDRAGCYREFFDGPLSESEMGKFRDILDLSAYLDGYSSLPMQLHAPPIGSRIMKKVSDCVALEGAVQRAVVAIQSALQTFNDDLRHDVWFVMSKWRRDNPAVLLQITSQRPLRPWSPLLEQLSGIEGVGAAAESSCQALDKPRKRRLLSVPAGARRGT